MIRSTPGKHDAIDAMQGGKAAESPWNGTNAGNRTGPNTNKYVVLPVEGLQRCRFSATRLERARAIYIV
jgi:hypothetical protein